MGLRQTGRASGSQREICWHNLKKPFPVIFCKGNIIYFFNNLVESELEVSGLFPSDPLVFAHDYALACRRLNGSRVIEYALVYISLGLGHTLIGIFLK